jgi:hypothetical protein
MFTLQAPEALQDLEELIDTGIREDARYWLDSTPAMIELKRETEEENPIPEMSAMEIHARLSHLTTRREALELALFEAEKRDLASAQAARGPHGSAAISRFLLDAEDAAEGAA